MTLVRSSRCRFSSSSALSFPFSSLNCRQGYIFVWRISISCVQLYFKVHTMLFSKSMRMWWDCGPICGNGRKDDTGGRYCISPNGQNSDGPIQCKSSHHYSDNTVLSHNYNYNYGQPSDRPGKRKRPVSSQHTDHYFRRCALLYPLYFQSCAELENFQSSQDNPRKLRVAGSVKSV